MYVCKKWAGADMTSLLEQKGSGEDLFEQEVRNSVQSFSLCDILSPFPSPSTPCCGKPLGYTSAKLLQQGSVDIPCCGTVWPGGGNESLTWNRKVCVVSLRMDVFPI
ncbi:hypothetical protein AOLI_G00050170 [Acnodon oligacanthus]